MVVKAKQYFNCKQYTHVILKLEKKTLVVKRFDKYDILKIKVIVLMIFLTDS